MIKSIHGIEGGLDQSSRPFNSSGPWKKIANLKEGLLKFDINLPMVLKKKLKMVWILYFGKIIGLVEAHLQPNFLTYIIWKEIQTP